MLNRKSRKNNRLRIYINFNSRFNTLTFKPSNQVITAAKLKKIKSTDLQPIIFSVPLFMTNVIQLLIREDSQIYIHAKVAKYLLEHVKFKKTLAKLTKANLKAASHCSKKESRARKPETKKNWKAKAKKYTDEYKRLVELKEVLELLIKTIT